MLFFNKSTKKRVISYIVAMQLPLWAILKLKYFLLFKINYTYEFLTCILKIVIVLLSFLVITIIWIRITKQRNVYFWMIHHYPIGINIVYAKFFLLPFHIVMLTQLRDATTGNSYSPSFWKVGFWVVAIVFRIFKKFWGRTNKKKERNEKKK